MNEEKRNRILDKLRKLTDLRDSAKMLGNEGEANAAAAGISRLLLEYNLSEDDIPVEEREKNPVVMERIPYRCRYFAGNWYGELVDVLCDYNLCQNLINSIPKGKYLRYSRESFSIVGRKKNVEIVLYLAEFLSFQFVTIGKSNYPKYKRECLFERGEYPVGENKFVKSFLYGCVSGLEEQYKQMKAEMKAELSTTALAIRTEQEINLFLQDMKIGKIKGSAIPELNSVAFEHGYTTGQEINLQSGLEQKVGSKTLRLE